VNFRGTGERSSKKRRHRHSGGKPEHSVWQFGAGIIPPAALIGVTLAAFCWIKPEFSSAPMVRMALLGFAGLIAVGLGTIFYGMRPGSKRLERKEVWIAIVAGFLTLGFIGATVLRGRFMPEKPAAPAGEE
jgi:apolipoprotein N-acyltransferase